MMPGVTGMSEPQSKPFMDTCHDKYSSMGGRGTDTGCYLLGATYILIQVVTIQTDYESSKKSTKLYSLIEQKHKGSPATIDFLVYSGL